jgi:hypothetical protein
VCDGIPQFGEGIDVPVARPMSTIGRMTASADRLPDSILRVIDDVMTILAARLPGPHLAEREGTEAP